MIIEVHLSINDGDCERCSTLVIAKGIEKIYQVRMQKKVCDDPNVTPIIIPSGEISVGLVWSEWNGRDGKLHWKVAPLRDS